MKYNLINKKNIYLLKNFIELNNSKKFRYFENRNIDTIKNHVVTIIITDNKNIIGYGHLDFEKYIWLGICVLKEYQGRGYGKNIMIYLINYAREKNINCIRLSVDCDNHRAISLYKKYNFKILDKNNTRVLMNLILKK